MCPHAVTKEIELEFSGNNRHANQTPIQLEFLRELFTKLARYPIVHPNDDETKIYRVVNYLFLFLKVVNRNNNGKKYFSIETRKYFPWSSEGIATNIMKILHCRKDDQINCKPLP